MANTISSFDDVIDSRDVIAEIERLQDDKTDAQTEANELLARITELENEIWTEEIGADINALVDDVQSRRETDSDEKSYFTSSSFGIGEQSDLEDLLKLASEGEQNCSEWSDGAVLIRDSYFQDYAEQFADDIGVEIPDTWPNNCIDWKKAARELQYDYTSITFAGIDYWVRS